MVHETCETHIIYKYTYAPPGSEWVKAGAGCGGHWCPPASDPSLLWRGSPRLGCAAVDSGPATVDRTPHLHSVHIYSFKGDIIVLGSCRSFLHSHVRFGLLGVSHYVVVTVVID